MDAFWARFQGFTPDPNSSLITNFNLLSTAQNWAPAGRARSRAHRRFRSAMIDEFNATYGTDNNDLESWKNLCRVVRVDPVPETITQCRKAVRRTHVNLVDLIDHDVRNGGGQVKKFKTLRQLREYTHETEKYFPKNPAKAGGILKALLRDMNAPVDDSEI
ncbi:uncharacterized protein LAJ45_00801 [Morchella importuna]|uniref:Rho-GAP domain-containing protein n=1 Tax=Morchella conica CCBAS932 TaxID=1392247 RepID=A0A3N4KI82_9PEZI|nr:uncharacterized protein LAJ45_00801 [Morchella importuna]KAH8155789.1 hypothetical protein LAJ45_00801 [Morchella importuna]RPB10266.1 hypothetical protein P167DRAFT_491156 [Morchella conica CCBAS932]